MSYLNALLLSILLTDVVNPILFFATVQASTDSKPFRSGFCMLGSFFLAYFGTGLVLAFGIDAATKSFSLSGNWDYVIEFFVALLLLYMGFSQYNRHAKPLREEFVEKTPLTYALLGVEVHLIAIPFMAPYLAVIDLLLRAKLSYMAIFTYLLVYNLLYITPFALLIVLVFLLGQKSKFFLERLNKIVDFTSSHIIPFLFIGLGLLLLEDVFSYFVGYRPWSLLSLTREEG
jgi:cytochrome c biogenesis protein CcdA